MALFNYKIKIKTGATQGYSLLLTFETILPDDVDVVTFAQFEVSDIFRVLAEKYSILIFIFVKNSLSTNFIETRDQTKHLLC